MSWQKEILELEHRRNLAREMGGAKASPGSMRREDSPLGSGLICFSTAIHFGR